MGEGSRHYASELRCAIEPGRVTDGLTARRVMLRAAPETTEAHRS